jgi:hypothetical protein
MALQDLDSGLAEEARTACREAARLHLNAGADGSADYAFMEAAMALDVEKAGVLLSRVKAKRGSKGASRREVDRWGDARGCLRRRRGIGKELARLLPVVGTYQFKSWRVDMIRGKLTEEKPTADRPAADRVGELALRA